MNKLISSVAAVGLGVSLVSSVASAQAVHVGSNVEQTSTTLADGKQTNFSISVSRDGKETKITQDESGVHVAYPGKDGEKIEVSAKDEAELKNKAPDAYAVYEKYVHPQANAAPNVFFAPGARGRTLVIPPEGFRSFSFPNGGMNDAQSKQFEDAMKRAEEAMKQAEESFRNNGGEQRVWRNFGNDAAPQQMAPAEPNAPRAENATPEASAAGPRLGVQVEDASDDLQAQLGKGAIVRHVLPNSRAAKLGIQEHDMIRNVDGNSVASADELRSVMKSAGDKKISIELLRAGQVVTLKENDGN